MPTETRTRFDSIVERGPDKLPNMLLTGTAGTGKTTTALALVQDLGIPYLYINGSEARGIDTIRTTVENFATNAVSDFDDMFSDEAPVIKNRSGIKVVVIDEADNLTHDAQKALRAFIENNGRTCRFIFTCNYPERIIDPLKSRLQEYIFSVPNEEMASIRKQLAQRVIYICKQENIKVEDVKVVLALVDTYFPDNRKIFQTIDYASHSGVLSVDSLDVMHSGINEFIEHMIAKDHHSLMTWARNNKDITTDQIYNYIYDNVVELVPDSDIPTLIVLLNNGQVEASRDINKQINLVSTALIIGDSVQFKTKSLG